MYCATVFCLRDYSIAYPRGGYSHTPYVNLWVWLPIIWRSALLWKLPIVLTMRWITTHVSELNNSTAWTKALKTFPDICAFTSYCPSILNICSHFFLGFLRLATTNVQLIFMDVKILPRYLKAAVLLISRHTPWNQSLCPPISFLPPAHAASYFLPWHT